MASLDQVKAAIDAVAQKRGFRCVPVSWEDATRSNNGFGLSSVGPNISDVRLYEKSGKLLYTCRSQNWNERLGYVAAGDVAMVLGNEHSSASVQTPTTLRDYLQSVGTHARYAGVQVPSLFEPTLDEIFSIRFQTVFLPVEQAGPGGAFASAFGIAKPPPPATEFCTEVYNYQTRDASDPKNLLLLATPQGTSVQQDGAGASKVFFHSVDSDGVVHRFWLEAEKSEKQVGGAQAESMEEVAEAASRGKATAVRLGPSSMGTRFNVQMLIQVPLKQRAPQPHRGGWGANRGGSRGRGGFGQCFPGAGGAFGMALAQPVAACAMMMEESSAPKYKSGKRSATAGKVSVGVSNAARVSRGSEYDVYGGVANPNPQRDSTQHGTITVTMYYTVLGGVPSADDVERAVSDLDALYKACPSDKRLVNCHEITSSRGLISGFTPSVLPRQPATIPAPVAGGTHCGPAAAPCSCTKGHPLSAMYGGEDFEPQHGWWCDGCGVFMYHGPVKGGAVSMPKGYGCRGCNFDLCFNCAFMPTCVKGHPLVCLPAEITSGKDTLPCSGCHRRFATHVAVLRGCAYGNACQTVVCQSCFTAETIRRRM